MIKEKKQKAKQVGIIGCIGAGLFGVYQLLFGGGVDSESLNNLKENLSGALQDKIKVQLKQVVKEALREYELEKKVLTPNK